MKIYTKKGDRGETSLFGGKRVVKHDIQIEAYGTVDELNSHIGLLRSLIKNKEAITALKRVQAYLFVIGSTLAADADKKNLKLPALNSEEATFLETQIDKCESNLPAMTSFILPGGTTNASHCHIARTICRRAERATTKFAASSDLEPIVLTYLNRLSDYLFILARQTCIEERGEETPWLPKK
jgi:cob(I)alamin adenosyltransferase